MSQEAHDKLNALAELHEKLRLHNEVTQEKLAATIPQEVKDAQEQIRFERDGYRDKLEGEIGDLVTSIKGLVVETGVTVKADSLMAVYVKGRKTWDGKALEGYATAHPEILTHQKVGKPSVSIRERK